MKKKIGNLPKSGFTLIELLIVISMLAILFIALIATINPLGQYNKAQDSQRQHDLGQIQRALDTYFNDTHCYPTSLPFGGVWSVSGQLYMEKVPQDPQCSYNSKKCYGYETDGSSCPQWNVLYASLSSTTIIANACPLVTRNMSQTCLPQGFSSTSFNACVVSGNIDCTAVSSSGIIVSGAGGGGGGGGGGPTATPTPVVSCPNNQYYACTGDNRCNSIGLDPRTHTPLLCSGFGGPYTCYCDQHCDQSCRYN